MDVVAMLRRFRRLLRRAMEWFVSTLVPYRPDKWEVPDATEKVSLAFLKKTQAVAFDDVRCLPLAPREEAWALKLLRKLPPTTSSKEEAALWLWQRLISADKEAAADKEATEDGIGVSLGSLSHLDFTADLCRALECATLARIAVLAQRIEGSGKNRSRFLAKGIDDSASGARWILLAGVLKRMRGREPEFLTEIARDIRVLVASWPTVGELVDTLQPALEMALDDPEEAAAFRKSMLANRERELAARRAI